MKKLFALAALDLILTILLVALIYNGLYVESGLYNAAVQVNSELNTFNEISGNTDLNIETYGDLASLNQSLSKAKSLEDATTNFGVSLLKIFLIFLTIASLVKAYEYQVLAKKPFLKTFGLILAVHLVIVLIFFMYVGAAASLTSLINLTATSILQVILIIWLLLSSYLMFGLYMLITNKKVNFKKLTKIHVSFLLIYILYFIIVAKISIYLVQFLSSVTLIPFLILTVIVVYFFHFAVLKEQEMLLEL